MLLNYILSHELPYVAIQYILSSLGIYILAPIKQKKIFILELAIVGFLQLFFYSIINVLSLLVFWTLLVLLLFRHTKKIYISISLPSLVFLIYIIMNYIVDVFAYKINEKYDVLMVTVPLSSILFLICIFVIRYVYIYVSGKITISERLKHAGAILSLITFFSYFIIITIERFYGQESSMGHANGFFIILYGIISTSVLLMLMYSFQKDFAVREKEKEMHYLNEYTTQLEQNYAEMRRFKHDYQNILLSMEDYIKTEDLVGLKDYFYSKIKVTSSEMSQNNFKLSQMGHIKNRELKSILTSKLLVSQEKGIDTEVEIKEVIEPLDLGSDTITLIRSLGIVLDNAIESAKTIVKGFVRVAVFNSDNKVVIVIANSCVEDIPKLFWLKKEGFSTKGENRGMGLSNLDNMISKSKKLSLETKIEGEIFYQIIRIGR